MAPLVAVLAFLLPDLLVAEIAEPEVLVCVVMPWAPSLAEAGAPTPEGSGGTGGVGWAEECKEEGSKVAGVASEGESLSDEPA